MALFTPAEALEFAMRIEKNGELFYNSVASKAADPDVKTLLQELAAQEQHHYMTFSKMASSGNWIASRSPEEGFDSDEYGAYIQAALDSALFAGPDKALAAADQAHDRQAVLRAAVGFEKDTLLFFYDLQDMVAGPERETVAAIIREEKMHLRRLAKFL